MVLETCPCEKNDKTVKERRVCLASFPFLLYTRDMNEKIFKMSFAQVYPALEAKVERKGGSRQSVDRVTSWMTGYSLEELESIKHSDVTYATFFEQAPSYAAARQAITGKICGVQIETISHPVMLEIRRLDKLVDLLAKGKSVEAVIAAYEEKYEKL